MSLWQGAAITTLGIVGLVAGMALAVLNGIIAVSNFTDKKWGRSVFHVAGMIACMFLTIWFVVWIATLPIMSEPIR